MCTLSVVSSLDRSSLRLMINRDERRLRPVAQPPVLRLGAEVASVWPTDPVSGGTWVAANECGLGFAMMSLDGHRTPPGSPSRGTLIPMLVGAHDIDEVAEGWRALDTAVFAPFRLVVVGLHELAVFERGAVEPTLRPLAGAHVFSSSALGDDLVEGPRRALLADLLRREIDPWMAQSRFHHHAWPDRRHLSVLMSRVNACTVSCTEVVLHPASVTMTYRPLVDGWPAGTTMRQLPVIHRAVRAA